VGFFFFFFFFFLLPSLLDMKFEGREGQEKVKTIADAM
jgi:hypothetical protein